MSSSPLPQSITRLSLFLGADGNVWALQSDGRGFMMAPGAMGYLVDAPNDGNGYVRQNGLWVPGALPSQVFVITTPGQGTWNKPPGAKWIKAIVIGDGGGGASGRRSASGTAASGGYGGGGGGYSWWEGPASVVPNLVYYQVGSGGTGGAPQTANDTNGNPGVAGTFSGSWWGAATNIVGAALCTAQAGYGGPGGQATIGGAAGNCAGVFPGGQMGAGSITAAPGLAPYPGVVGTVVGYLGLGAGGGGCGGPVTVGAAAFGGGGGSPGPFGGRNRASEWATGGAIGANGNSPTDTNAASYLPGLGGSGGGGSITPGVNGGDGGNGSAFGGAGGGGGAALNTAGNSGKGGNGAPGLLMILVEF